MTRTFIIFSVVILTLILDSCRQQPLEEKLTDEILVPYDSLRTDLHPVFDSAHAIGSILVYDPEQQIFFSNDFDRSTKGFLPASTFKIPNSIIALETGVVESDSTLFKWNGEKRRLTVWEKDMIFREAFQLSCVPCYQEVARNIGVQRMQEYLSKFSYGNMVVDAASIDNFWLEGESRITMRQQIDFLFRFYFEELPVSERTTRIVKRMMRIDSTDTYTLYGKTGWAIRNGANTGWFVGFIEKGENVWFFATNIEPNQEFNMDLFPMIRSKITIACLKQLGIIP